MGSGLCVCEEPPAQPISTSALSRLGNGKVFREFMKKKLCFKEALKIGTNSPQRHGWFLWGVFVSSLPDGHRNAEGFRLGLVFIYF